MRQVRLVIILLLLSKSCFALFLEKKQKSDDSIRYNEKINILKSLNKRALSSSDADSILYYSRVALDFAKTNSLSVSRSLLGIGEGYLLQGEHALALEFFTKAVESYEEEQDSKGLATAYTYMSRVYSSQKNQRNSIIYLNKSIYLLEEINDTIRLANALHNLGYEYYLMNYSDSALILFSRAKKEFNKLGYDLQIAYCIGNSGLVFMQQKKYEKAKINLEEAIEILLRYNDNYAIIEFTNSYAEVLYELGEARNAIDYAKHSYTLAIENNIKEYERDAAFCLSKLYGAVNQFDSAFFYLESYYAVRDSIKNLESIQQMADLRTEFEVNQKQQEVDSLLKSKTIQLIIISALLIIIILATWLIVVYRKNLYRVREFTATLDKRRKELEKQKAELKELNSVKDKFFSIISHDLRSPINSLGGISFMIRESIENENPQLLWEVVDYIDKTTFSLSSLLDNLLNWAMFQQGKLNFEVGKIEIKPIVNEVVSLFSTFIISKNIQLKLNVEDNIFISGEKNSIMTIFRNLMSNAIKFTEKGKGISIICGKEGDGWVKLVLEDQGVGIPKDKLNDLFRIGKNKSTLGTEKEKGLGLGLSLVHEFVTLNKGEINVESEEGVGTRFIIFLKELV